jgi:hypothetical protein
MPLVAPVTKAEVPDSWNVIDLLLHPLPVTVITVGGGTDVAE